MEQQANTAEGIMELVRRLPYAERVRLYTTIKETQEQPGSLEEYLTEQRFSGGRVCPICGGTHVHRNGKRKNGSQKYICKDCGKTFSIRKNTVFSGTRKDISTWMTYMDCMAEGLSLDASAERCGLTHKTAFIWRHKILDAIGESMKDTGLKGIIEADETFLPVSYKGDASAFTKDTAGRKARKRGGENHKKGLSAEQVCIPCAVDRKGNAVSKVAKLGKCSAEALEKTIGGHIPSESTLCSDADASYRKFSRSNGNRLVQIKEGKSSIKGIFHIQHLNAYHSKLKSFLRRFYGVSTKYLNNYLTWNNAIEYKKRTLRGKAEEVLSHLSSVLFEETCLDVPLRPGLPLLVKNQS